MGDISNFLLKYYRLDIKTLISSVQLQDTQSVYKNQLRFYTLTISSRKRNFKILPLGPSGGPVIKAAHIHYWGTSALPGGELKFQMPGVWLTTTTITDFD